MHLTEKEMFISCCNDCDLICTVVETEPVHANICHQLKMFVQMIIHLLLELFMIFTCCPGASSEGLTFFHTELPR